MNRTLLIQDHAGLWYSIRPQDEERFRKWAKFILTDNGTADVEGFEECLIGDFPTSDDVPEGTVMASKKERVRITGVLRGQGRIVPVTLWVTKVTLRHDLPPAYANYELVDAPAIPNGIYEITVMDQTERVKYEDGLLTGPF